MAKLMFSRVLVANRGEIASRIIRTLGKMNIFSIAIFDEREKDVGYVKQSDMSLSLGQGGIDQTFLNISAIIELAKKSKAEAIHPGYGFLSENAAFAKRCNDEGIVFIGPQPETIELMGDKIQSLQIAKKLGIPVIQGMYGKPGELLTRVDDSFFPCMVKPSGGGGGKAMRIAFDRRKLPDMLVKTSSESEKYFGNSSVYIEKYLAKPRHVEVQVLGDRYGNFVQLGERECSVQRRYQKVIEESPVAWLDNAKRIELNDHALKLAREVNYQGAGTVEFLFDDAGNHYFLEMNARIQVEHPVTEFVTGLDLVEEQINIAAGLEISETVNNSKVGGHAIEVRICAENPSNNFLPEAGTATYIHFPVIENVRIDTAISTGDVVHSEFDSLLAKVIAWGATRNVAIDKMKLALSGTLIHGLATNINMLINILDNIKFKENTLSTHYLQENLAGLLSAKALSSAELSGYAAAGLFLSMNYSSQETEHLPQNIRSLGYWRLFPLVKGELDGNEIEFLIRKTDSQGMIFTMNGETMHIKMHDHSDHLLSFSINNETTCMHYSWESNKDLLFLSTDSVVHRFRRADFLQEISYAGTYTDGTGFIQDSKIVAPLSGKIISLNCQPDDQLQMGETMCIIESMKMENEIRSFKKGTVKRLFVKINDQVSEGDLLIEFDPILD
jgi:3-methylcrotonyl-CoA carboxylase alpha subunit